MSEPSDFPPYPSEPHPSEPYQPGPALPVTRPPRPAAAGHRVGRASGVQTRVEARGNERSSVTVLNFRVVDADGGQAREVELRGVTLSGSVHEGDWVEFSDQPSSSGRYLPARVTNLTTGAQVQAASGMLPKPLRAVFVIVFVLLFLAALGFILVGFLTMGSSV